MDRFAVVRCAGKSDFFVSETKPIRGAGDQQRQRLKRLSRRSQKGNGVRRTERCGDVAVRFDSSDVTAVPRLGNASTSDFDQRFGERDLLLRHVRRILTRRQ